MPRPRDSKRRDLEGLTEPDGEEQWVGAARGSESGKIHPLMPLPLCGRTDTSTRRRPEATAEFRIDHLLHEGLSEGQKICAGKMDK